jgi:hypothetical protein
MGSRIGSASARVSNPQRGLPLARLSNLERSFQSSREIRLVAFLLRIQHEAVRDFLSSHRRWSSLVSEVILVEAITLMRRFFAEDSIIHRGVHPCSCDSLLEWCVEYIPV